MMKVSSPAHVLQDFDEDLQVGEAADMAAGQRLAEIGGDRLGQRPIGIAGQNLHLAGQGPSLQSQFVIARSEATWRSRDTERPMSAWIASLTLAMTAAEQAP